MIADVPRMKKKRARAQARLAILLHLAPTEKVTLLMTIWLWRFRRNRKLFAAIYLPFGIFLTIFLVLPVVDGIYYHWHGVSGCSSSTKHTWSWSLVHYYCLIIFIYPLHIIHSETIVR